MARSTSPARASASASAIFTSPSYKQNVLFAQQFDAATHVRQARRRRAAFSLRPTLEKHPPRAAITGDHARARVGRVRAAFVAQRVMVAAHQFEHGRVHSRIYPSVPTWVSAATPRLRVAIDERNRAIDLARAATRQARGSSIAATPGSMAEAKGQIVVTTGLEQGERAFQMIPRLAIFAGEPARYPSGAMSDAGLGRIRVSPRRR